MHQFIHICHEHWDEGELEFGGDFTDYQVLPLFPPQAPTWTLERGEEGWESSGSWERAREGRLVPGNSRGGVCVRATPMPPSLPPPICHVMFI